MVKVKMNVARTGGVNAGDVIEVDADEAERMMAKGQCELVRAKTPEKAVSKRKAEKASK